MLVIFDSINAAVDMFLSCRRFVAVSIPSWQGAETNGFHKQVIVVRLEQCSLGDVNRYIRCKLVAGGDLLQVTKNKMDPFRDPISLKFQTSPTVMNVLLLIYFLGITRRGCTPVVTRSLLFLIEKNDDLKAVS